MDHIANTTYITFITCTEFSITSCLLGNSLEVNLETEEPVHSQQEPGILEVAVDSEEPVHSLLEFETQVEQLELGPAVQFAVPLFVGVGELEG